MQCNLMIKHLTIKKIHINNYQIKLLGDGGKIWTSKDESQNHEAYDHDLTQPEGDALSMAYFEDFIETNNELTLVYFTDLSFTRPKGKGFFTAIAFMEKFEDEDTKNFTNSTWIPRDAIDYYSHIASYSTEAHELVHLLTGEGHVKTTSSSPNLMFGHFDKTDNGSILSYGISGKLTPEQCSKIISSKFVYSLKTKICATYISTSLYKRQ